MSLQAPPTSVTRTIARLAAERDLDAIPDDIVWLVRQCVLDMLGVALAGAGEPSVQLLLDDALSERSAPAHAVIGRKDRLSLYRAAQVNGFIAHVLDYDDVHMVMEGHPTAACLPALLSLGEMHDASGADLVVAFLSAYEAGCHIGAFLGPAHYARGFHNTATVGAMATAAGASRMLGLDPERTATAIGIAATQAAGLKVMFGTMSKPLHAGEANRGGLFAARLSASGFTGREDVLESRFGFAESHGSDRTASVDFEAGPDFHIRRNLFKYHASCYKTHAPIDAARKSAGGRRLAAEDVASVTLTVDPSLDAICNILEPTTGLESKFSLRHTVALALAGVDTASLDTFVDTASNDPAITGLRSKVHVAFAGMDANAAEIELRLSDGSRHAGAANSDRPNFDLADQQRRLEAKFVSLVEPVLGRGRTIAVIEMVNALQGLRSVRTLMDAVVA